MVSSKIEAVIWDIGGVLWRNEDQSSRLQLSEKLGIPLDVLYTHVFLSETAELATLGKITENDHWQAIAEAIGILPDDIPAFRRDWWAGNQFDLDLLAFIRKLRSNFKVGILSNAWSDARVEFSRILEEMGMNDHVLFSAEVGLKKPDPAIYMKLLSLMEVKPENTVFIDDSEENIDAANRLGIHGMLFTSSAQVREDLLMFLKL